MTRDFVWDLRYAARRLRAEPLISLTAAATLALGVSATVVMADILDRLLVRPPPHVTNHERVVRLYTTRPRGTAAMGGTYATFTGVAARATEAFDHLVAYRTEALSFGRGTAAQRVSVVTHTGSYFDVFGVVPHLGVFPRADTSDGGALAVIGHGLWTRSFGASPEVVGQTFELDGNVYTVTAIAPPGFVGVETDRTDIWRQVAPGEPPGRSFTSFIGRLRPDIDRRVAAAQLAGGLGPEYDAVRATLHVEAGELMLARAPGPGRQVRITIWVAGVSLLVLLTACGNVGGLLFLRGARRRRETAIKLALGATRSRLCREVVAEALLLAIAAGGATVGLLTLVAPQLRRLLLPPIAAADVPLDARVVLLTAVSCAAVLFALSLAPTLSLLRHRFAYGAEAAPDRRAPALGMFVVLQVALSVPLLAGAGLFAASLWNAYQHDYGLKTDDIVVVEVTPDVVGTEAHASHRAIEERLAALPYVSRTAVVESVTLRNAVVRPIRVPGHDHASGADFVAVNAVDPAYVEFFGLQVIAGRTLHDDDNRPGARLVAVVNDAFVRHYWPDQQPLGQCFVLQLRDLPCAEVVGVVRNVQTDPSLSDAALRGARPSVLLAAEPARVLGGARALLLQTQRASGSVLPEIQRIAQTAAPGLPYVDVWALDDVFEPTRRPWRLGAAVFSAFALVSLLIAAGGLAVVTAYGVTRRTREIGIRAAIGASPRGLVLLVMRGNLWAVGVGLTVGFAIAYVGGRSLEALLYGISPHDPRLLTAVAVVLLLVATMAAWLPARRAGRTDPAAALRAE